MIWVVWAVLKSLGNEWRNYNISHKLLRPSQFLEKIYENSGMVHFAEINQPPPSYSMLQYIGRVATPKLVSRNCLRYLQTTLIMGGGGLVSEFMWGIADIPIVMLCLQRPDSFGTTYILRRLGGRVDLTCQGKNLEQLKGKKC